LRRRHHRGPRDRRRLERGGPIDGSPQLKRKGLRRTRLRSLAGAQTWVGGITLAHNLQRMALLTWPAPPETTAASQPAAAATRDGRSTFFRGK
jgi:hypothetical protein